jgi:hypothetical protein
VPRFNFRGADVMEWERFKISSKISRKIRPGNRVKLFYFMRGIYLDKLAMAGGGACELPRKIKYEALRGYREITGGMIGAHNYLAS